jgi:hypothetical protein
MKMAEDSKVQQWQVYSCEGPIKAGHKTGHPATYSICIDGDYDHHCIAMTFGETDEEAYDRAKLIVDAVAALERDAAKDLCPFCCMYHLSAHKPSPRYEQENWWIIWKSEIGLQGGHN